MSAIAAFQLQRRKPDALRLAEQAYELASAVADRRQLLDAGMALGHVLVSSCPARALLEGLYRSGANDEWLSTRPVVSDLVEPAPGIGIWRPSGSTEGMPSSTRSMTENRRCERHRRARCGLIAVISDRARRLAKRGREAANGQLWNLVWYESVLGLVELWDGDPGRAVARFAAAERAGRAADLVEPSAFLWRADHVEALLALGRISDAVEVLDAWEADATRVGREWYSRTRHAAAVSSPRAWERRNGRAGSRASRRAARRSR